ncbi:MAG: alkaline phosphatase [Desulfobacterales bacterium]|jgi:alkaline phosphatase|nr:alkaline phosphatase [Desulfobacterales bacterium]
MKTARTVKAVSIFLLGVSLVAHATGAVAGGRHEAKHIILLIGDGMHIEHEVAASRYFYGEDFALSFHKLPYQADVATWDVTTYKHWSGGSYDPNAIDPRLGYDPDRGGKRPFPLGPELPGAQAYLTAKATDSASAATAWATGYKTDDGNIAWLPGDPEGGALKTIAEWLRAKKGFAIGVVSTVPFTHATPAAHVSHNKSRNNYHAIGAEILGSVKPEVVIGAGYPAGSSCLQPMESSYLALKTYADVCADPAYKVVTRQTGIDGGTALLQAAQEAAAQGLKLFGLFGGTAGHFESLKPYDFPGTPAVKPVSMENPTLAEASLAALKVLGQDPDGFFVAIEQGDIDWANHANDFQRMVGTTKDLHDAAQAIIDFVNQPDDEIDWDNTLLIVTSDHSNSYMRNQRVLGAGDLPKQTTTGSLPGYPDGEVTYGSTNHTNELVRLYAMGAGIQKFSRYEGKWYRGTRILDNTQLFHMMMEASGEPMPSLLKLKQGMRMN